MPLRLASPDPLREGCGRLRAGLKTRPVRAPGQQAAACLAKSCRPRALTRSVARVFKHALSRNYSVEPILMDHRDAMPTEKAKDWPTDFVSPKGDCLERMQASVVVSTTTLLYPRTPRGFFQERGWVRGPPAAAGWPHGTPPIQTGVCAVSRPLRLVLARPIPTQSLRNISASLPPLAIGTLLKPSAKSWKSDQTLTHVDQVFQFRI